MGLGTIADSALLSIESDSATHVGLQVKAAASATSPAFVVAGGATPGAGGDLVQLKNSAGTILGGFNSGGQLFFENTNTGTVAWIV